MANYPDWVMISAPPLGNSFASFGETRHRLEESFMAKINRFVAEYTEIMAGAGFRPGDGTPTKAAIHRFLHVFKDIKDSRVKSMIDYPIEDAKGNYVFINAISIEVKKRILHNES